MNLNFINIINGILPAMLLAFRRKNLPGSDLVPHGGLIVNRHDVERHRYLRDHGLSHIPHIAAIRIPKDSRGLRVVG